MSDTELELLLKVHRQHPAEWEALDPAVKLEALNYEAHGREQEALNGRHDYQRQGHAQAFD